LLTKREITDAYQRLWAALIGSDLDPTISKQCCTLLA